MEIIQNKSDVGLVRPTNEDIAISIKHPKDKELILLLVADGMGGKEFGEIASTYVAKAVEQWFISRGVSTINNFDKLEVQLREVVDKANSSLIEKYGENVLGTTLSIAIIAHNRTFIANVGDSRVYTYRKKKLIQITEDDSDVWFYYKYSAVRKDDLRFFFNNNIITSCVGISYDLCKMNTYIIPNDYQMILVFSDGVTDLITDRRIKSIIETNKKKDVLSKIIYEAVNVDQHFHIPLRLKRKNLSKYILPYRGRDNASGAIYIKE